LTSNTVATQQWKVGRNEPLSVAPTR